jgi:hypothetical protein
MLHEATVSRRPKAVLRWRKLTTRKRPLISEIASSTTLTIFDLVVSSECHAAAARQTDGCIRG